MKVLKNILAGMFVGLVLVTPAVADNGCEIDENDAIVAELALCSTHAYNIGATKNPSGADKELMRDVIAMKTTLITQQMYRQYEQMESMLRRLKTQLEKAVLTTKFNVAGAVTSSGDSRSAYGISEDGFQSNDRNIHMADVKNCNSELLPADVLQCLNDNMSVISEKTGNADNVNSEVAKQLANDFALLKNVSVGNGGGNDDKCVYKISTSDTKETCLDNKQIRKKKNFRTCFDNMRNCLRNKMYILSQNERKAK
ncbi:MAG: hypothetical protein IIV74_00695 [Alphaproteobacteria bacterium]|nr:hypothetical protein [Alphaproteobacteria bacterium]